MTKKETISITGHRPEKLINSESEIKKRIRAVLLDKIKAGKTNIMTGLSRGVELYSGEVVLEIKKVYPEVSLTVVLPYDNYEKNWNTEIKIRYQNVIKEADEIICIKDKYSREALVKRNEYLIDNACELIAVYNGEKGNTKDMLSYAKKQNVPAYIIND